MNHGNVRIKSSMFPHLSRRGLHLDIWCQSEDFETCSFHILFFVKPQIDKPLAYCPIFKTQRNFPQAHTAGVWGRHGRDFAWCSNLAWVIYLLYLVEIESCIDSCPQFVRGIKIQMRRKHTHVKKNLTNKVSKYTYLENYSVKVLSSLSIDWETQFLYWLKRAENSPIPLEADFSSPIANWISLWY